MGKNYFDCRFEVSVCSGTRQILKKTLAIMPEIKKLRNEKVAIITSHIHQTRRKELETTAISDQRPLQAAHSEPVDDDGEDSDDQYGVMAELKIAIPPHSRQILNVPLGGKEGCTNI